ncbi:MAG: hypothetical protein SNI51_03055 [Rikenellaceae bacterium]
MRLRALLLFAALSILCGCGDTTKSLAEITEVKPSGWYTPAEITFEVSDTTSLFDMQILLRYDSYISADSVELMVSTTAPDGVMWSDEFTIGVPAGEHSLQIIEKSYRKSIMWGQAGEYRVSLHPMHLYRGISAVGVNITNSQ